MAIQSVGGTWFGLPDFGLTELINTSTGRSTAPSFTNNPAVYQSTYGSSQPTAQQQQSTTFFGGSPTPVLKGTNTSYPTNQQTGGQVLGTNTNTGSYSAPQPSAPSWEDVMRGDINNKYNGYFNQLNDMLNNDLPQQRATNEALVQNQYNAGLNNLTTQKTGQLNELDTTQAKSLKDISANTRNLFQAGSQFLGSRGAGDSSASDQMSYAIGKLGSKQRGDVMTQISSRRNQINDVFNSQTNQLDSERNSNLLNVANWFSQSQASLKQMIAQGQLNKGTDMQNLSQQLYNQSINALNQINQDYTNKRNTLMTWAANNAKSIDQVISTLQSIGAYQPQPMNTTLPVSISDGTAYTMGGPSAGYGATNTKERDLFGNIRS